jgi:hypothetical protein
MQKKRDGIRKFPDFFFAYSYTAGYYTRLDLMRPK